MPGRSFPSALSRSTSVRRVRDPELRIQAVRVTVPCRGSAGLEGILTSATLPSAIDVASISGTSRKIRITRIWTTTSRGLPPLPVPGCTRCPVCTLRAVTTPS